MTPQERQKLREIQQTQENRCNMNVCSRPSKNGTSPRTCLSEGRCRRRAQATSGDRFADK
jgi:hypothetical protein